LFRAVILTKKKTVPERQSFYNPAERNDKENGNKPTKHNLFFIYYFVTNDSFQKVFLLCVILLLVEVKGQGTYAALGASIQYVNRCPNSINVQHSSLGHIATLSNG
jgi:hypothetical protein